MRRLVITVLAAASVVMGLAACTMGASTGTAPAPSSTGSARPTASEPSVPIPVDSLDDVTSLVARPLGLELRDSDGTVIQTLDYMGDASAAVAALTVVFGGAPTDGAYDRRAHSPAGVNHVWDEFTLDERHYDEAARASKGLDDVSWPRFVVYFDAPTSRGIALSTVQGHQAGDDWVDVQASPGVGIVGCNAVSAETVDLPVTHEGHDLIVTAGVGFRLNAAETEVRWVVAPETFGDTGCV